MSCSLLSSTLLTPSLSPSFLTFTRVCGLIRLQSRIFWDDTGASNVCVCPGCSCVLWSMMSSGEQSWTGPAFIPLHASVEPGNRLLHMSTQVQLYRLVRTHTHTHTRTHIILFLAFLSCFPSLNNYFYISLLQLWHHFSFWDSFFLIRI